MKTAKKKITMINYKILHDFISGMNFPPLVSSLDETSQMVD